MYTRSLEVSKPWIVWRYGLGMFSFVVWIGGWFLTDEICLPEARDYSIVDDRDIDDTIEQEIEEEEERLWREEEDGTIDMNGTSSSGKRGRSGYSEEASKLQIDDDLDRSSNNEFSKG